LNFKLITSHVLRDGRQLGVHFALNSLNTYPTEETMWVKDVAKNDTHFTSRILLQKISICLSNSIAPSSFRAVKASTSKDYIRNHVVEPTTVERCNSRSAGQRMHLMENSFT